MPNGPLSLPARLCLLAWDTNRGEAAPPLVRAGALAELAQRGLLIDDDGVATPVDLDSRTGDAALDGLLELVSESCPHRWRTWVTLRARHTYDAVREQLVAEGVLRAEKHRILGVFPSVEYVPADAGRVRALRRQARGILEGPVPPEDVPERDAAVVALGAAAGLKPLLPGGAGPALEHRVECLAARAAAPPTAGIIRELRTALTTAAQTPPLPAGA
ncbi:GOLPH3/VPS74 family protein [Streptomyces fungicidicus]|uniref:GOLPH3/VPS74 family protein n=1 Tax=Streptomyces fungicidicus TaxID=68203 RepID=UPI0036BA8D4B